MQTWQSGSLPTEGNENMYARWRMHMKVARMAYDEGMYTAAARNYTSALAAAQTIDLPEEELAPTLLGLAVCLCETGKIDQGEALLKRVLALDESILGSQHYALADDLNYLADFYLRQARPQEAEQLLQRAMKILDQTKPVKTFQLARTLMELAKLCCEQGRFEEAEHHLARSSSLLDNSASRQTRLYAEVLMTMAMLAVKQSRHEDADELVRTAMQTIQMVTGGEHPEVAEFFELAARFMDQEGLTNKAARLREKASSVRAHLKQIDR